MMTGDWTLEVSTDNGVTMPELTLEQDGMKLTGHYVSEALGANEVTGQYTCRGDGYGRTHIRRETATLAQIDGQGIAGGKPFQFAAEARRVGSCR